MTQRIIIAISALALSACGRDASTSKQAPSAGAKPAGLKKPCEYMARADAEAAAGLPLPQTNEGVPLHEWEVASCSYLSPDFFSVELIVREWEGFHDGLKLARDRKPLIAVTGLGDEAWGEDNGIEFTRLYVRKGDRGLALTLNSPAIRVLDDKGLARAKVLALTIVPKI